MLFEFFIAISAGWACGLLARLCRLPMLIGYIVAGILIGPHLIGVIHEGAHIQALAELGVALLLFALGVQISLSDLLRVGKVAILGGLAQVVLTIGLGFLLGQALGWTTTASIILGFVLAVSSTTVLVKLLNDRGEIHTQYAKVCMGISITQDLTTVVMVSILPALGAASLAKVPELGLLFLKAGVFIAIMLVLARVVVPRLLRLVARTASKELFLTTIMVLCLAGAGLAAVLGLSLALGAFLAGLMISESEYHHETFATVLPLRDIFGVVFFVSLGMFLNPQIVARQWPDILLILAVLLVGKALIVTIIVLLAKYHLRTAMMAGLALTPISEFSFIIAMIAAAPALGFLSPERYGTIIAASILSIVVTPLLLAQGTALYRVAIRFRPLRRLTRAARENAELAEAHRQQEHVVVCGYGRVGQTASSILRHFGVPVVVIDYDQARVAALRTDGVLALYGDASSAVLLDQSGADHAQAVILSLPESHTSLLALRHLKRLNPDIPVMTRGTGSLIDDGYQEGAEEVVEPEFECGLELARHTLLRMNYAPTAVQAVIDDVRRERYRCTALQQMSGAPWV
ncbi:MAG: cation:proton antiporter [Armatimonadota bacterium]